MIKIRMLLNFLKNEINEIKELGVMPINEKLKIIRIKKNRYKSIDNIDSNKLLFVDKSNLIIPSSLLNEKDEIKYIIKIEDDEDAGVIKFMYYGKISLSIKDKKFLIDLDRRKVKAISDQEFNNINLRRDINE